MAETQKQGSLHKEKYTREFNHTKDYGGTKNEVRKAPVNIKTRADSAHST